MRKGGFIEDQGWFDRLIDRMRSGLEFRTFKVGRAAGHTLCTSPAIGTFAELDARDDLKALTGAMAVMLDRGTWGSNWVVINGAWVPDGEILGLGSPEGVIAAPVGATYRRIDATSTQALYYKASGTGNTGWTTDALGAMVNVRDPARDHGAKFDYSAVSTVAVQASLDEAAATETHGQDVGNGNLVRLRTGICSVGPLFVSRRGVGIEGSGASPGASVLRADYSSLGGVAGPDDAMLTYRDDGKKKWNINPQPVLRNFTLSGNLGAQPTGHRRHGIHVPKPVVSKSDRSPDLENLIVADMPGHGILIEDNDQVRGRNFKATDCDGIGIVWDSVSDGKVDQVGASCKSGGFKFNNCASLKVSKIDAWSPGTIYPTLFNVVGGERVWVGQVLSCKNLEISAGEIEGGVLVQGDNDKPNNDAWRWSVDVVFQNITFKPSSDYKAALGALYKGHLTIRDAFGVRLPGCGFGAGKGPLTDEKVIAALNARPPFAVYFETAKPETDPDYADYLAACGSCDCDTTNFMAYEPVTDSANTALNNAARCGFSEHLSNMPWLLKGVRPGTHRLLVTGTQGPHEIESSGQELTTLFYPLLYLMLESLPPGTPRTRKLTDRELTGPGSGSISGWKVFTNSNLNADMPPPPGFTWYVAHA